MLPNQPHNPLPDQLESPFLIRVEHLDVQRNGGFRPAAQVTFAAPLRTCGLLNALSPEAVKDLLMLLTFVTPNGYCSPSVQQLAEAMRVSEGKARGRMERLLALRWQGEPMLVHQKTESGLDIFAPRPKLAPVHEDGTPSPLQTPQASLPVAPREAIIAHTRATYGRPRAEVEQEIEALMGYLRDEQGRPHRAPKTQPMPAPRAVAFAQPQAPLTPQAMEALREHEEVKELLLQAGLQHEQAEALLEQFDTVRIRRQLMWLPYRRAKNPAGMLLAAVKDDYEAPPAFQRAPGVESAIEKALEVLTVSPSSSPALEIIEAEMDKGITLEIP